MRVLVFGNSGPGKTTLATRLANTHGLAHLQAWVPGCHEREDSWSDRAHRRLFDAFDGRKAEHAAPVADGPIAGDSR